jgi:uncharacterized membrane protein
MLIDTLCVILQAVAPVSVTAVSSIMVILYFTWAVGQFFGAGGKRCIALVDAFGRNFLCRRLYGIVVDCFFVFYPCKT